MSLPPKLSIDSESEFPRMETLIEFFQGIFSRLDSYY